MYRDICRDWLYKGDDSMTDVARDTRELPLLALRGLTVFPNMVLYFDVGRDKSISAIEKAMESEQEILLVSQKDAKIDDPDIEDIYTVGTIANIRQVLKLPGGTIRVLAEGLKRGQVIEYTKYEPHFEVVIEEESFDYSEEVILEQEALMRSILDIFEDYIKLSSKVSPELLLSVHDEDTPGKLADIIASNVLVKTEDKQSILNELDPVRRLEKLYGMLSKEIQILEIENKINKRIKKQVDSVQKEYYLRERLKAIQKELGEYDIVTNEIDEYMDKIEKSNFPEEVYDRVVKELNRLSMMPPTSAEGSVIRTYIDWILELPWNEETEDNDDLKRAAKILEEDHYGLKDVKERIIEYLVVKQLTDDMKGPILCFVGPPGVGKTSIAKSIARALDRKFVRMSLGGVRDESEIRGHRRTYVGAIPGRIISGIREAGTKNPVFLLDELDKMGSDFRGDPASALLEVLDREQNSQYRDHYLDLPFDLSKVMFITTANTIDTIPRPLLDRIEVIRIAGYTEEEKLNIGIKYLIPKQLKEHGLKKENILISDNTVLDIINHYTRESGVRNLEREIAKLCRKAARRLIETGQTHVRISASNLDKYLGIPKYQHNTIAKKAQLGVVTGLAWTAVGGETLSVEAIVMPGTGKLNLTGKLGDVMKESANAGLSYIRSKVKEFGIDSHFYKNTDIHVHVPEGAIPKDGPSAGITMATAIISALTQIPVKNNIAMTGEITLRGRVLPIGGLKEKALAAHRVGIEKIIIPIANKKDIEEIPDSILKEIEILTVEHMDEVLKHSLVSMPKVRKGKDAIDRISISAENSYHMEDVIT